MARLADTNALADRGPDSVWRLQTEDGDATAVRSYQDRRIMVDLSVRADPGSLRSYVSRGDHASVMRGGRQWFECFERLGRLDRHGPTPFAFTFGEPFGPDGARLPREAATRDAARPAAEPRPSKEISCSPGRPSSATSSS